MSKQVTATTVNVGSETTQVTKNIDTSYTNPSDLGFEHVYGYDNVVNSCQFILGESPQKMILYFDANIETREKTDVISITHNGQEINRKLTLKQEAKEGPTPPLTKSFTWSTPSTQPVEAEAGSVQNTYTNTFNTGEVKFKTDYEWITLTTNVAVSGTNVSYSVNISKNEGAERTGQVIAYSGDNDTIAIWTIQQKSAVGDHFWFESYDGTWKRDAVFYATSSTLSDVLVRVDTTYTKDGDGFNITMNHGVFDASWHGYNQPPTAITFSCSPPLRMGGTEHIIIYKLKPYRQQIATLTVCCFEWMTESESLNVDSAGETLTNKYVTTGYENMNFMAIGSNGETCDWIHFNSTGNVTDYTVSITVDANTSTQRTAYVYPISNGNEIQGKRWTIEQESAPITPRLELTTMVPDISASDTAITYTIKCNVATTVKYKEQTHTHNATEGETDSFSVPINESQGPVQHVITAYCTDSPSVSETLTFTQAGDDYVFSVSPRTFTFPGTGGTKQITVNNPNGYNWAITDLPEWYTASPMTGNATTNVNITATNNDTGAVRGADFNVNETSLGRTVATVSSNQGPQEAKIDVSVQGEVISSGGGACTYIVVQWTGLRVGSYIDLSAVNATIDSSYRQIEVIAEFGSHAIPQNPTVSENTQVSGRTISVTATWRDDTSVRDTYRWTQKGMYTVYELTVRGYNNDAVNSFDVVNDTPYAVQEYKMNCDTTIGNFGTLCEIDVDEYGNNSFGLPRESVSNIYDASGDVTFDVTLTINPKSSSGNHPAYCTIQWAFSANPTTDGYFDYKAPYDSNLNQYRINTSLTYPAGNVGRIFYIKKIIFSNN